MTYSLPVMEEARSDARNATSSATSSGRFGLPKGMPPSESMMRLSRGILADARSLGDFVDHSLGGLGFSVSGRNCVHANTPGTKLLREPFAVIRQSGLCCCVSQRGIKERKRSLNGRDMEDHASALLQHRWKKCSIQSDGGEQVCVERILPIVI